ETRRIDWPENSFYHGRPEGLDRDVVLLLGVEPNVRWRTFTGLIVDFARELGIELVVTLGALLADVPHTRPAPVSGSASDAALIAELGLSPSRYEGPTGSWACSTTRASATTCARRASGPRCRTTSRSRRA